MATEPTHRQMLYGYPWARGAFIVAGLIAEAFATIHTAAPVDLTALGLALFFAAFV